MEQLSITDVTGAYVDDTAPAYGRNADGYGDRIPTAYRLRLDDGRVRRVYVVCYGNAGSAYVFRNVGRRYYLDTSTETLLELMRDGASYDIARERVTMAPTSGKFSDIIAEAAYAISLHGFAEELGNVAELEGWNALVDVSATTLLNVGESAELVERFRAAVPGVAGTLAWIRADEQGFVTLVMHGIDDGARSGTDAVSRAWDRFTEESDSE